MGLKLTNTSNTISENVINLFVYDTSMDSDGGAWRKRCQNTSWYYESSGSYRGTRKEFPKVAIITVKFGDLIIYDADDPNLPMWMVFQRYGSGGSHSTSNMYGATATTNMDPTSIVAMNGLIVYGWNRSDGAEYGNATVIDMIGERCITFTNGAGDRAGWYKGNINERNSRNGFGEENRFAIHNSNTLSLAMTVPSNAQIDPKTGLPTPAIAVGSRQAVSIIRKWWDPNTSTVGANITSGHTDSADYPVDKVSFGHDNTLWVNSSYQGSAPTLCYYVEDDWISAPNGNNLQHYKNVNNTDQDGGTSGVYDYNLPPYISEYLGPGDPGVPGGGSYPVAPFASPKENLVAWGAIGSAGNIRQGLTQLRHSGVGKVYSGNRGDKHPRSMVAFTESTASTGWQFGDCRFSGLNSTVAGVVSAGNKVTDPRFASGHNFTTIQQSSTVTHDATNDWIEVTSSGGSNIYSGREVTGLTSGKRYWFYVNYKASSSHQTGIVLNTAWANGGTLIHGSNALSATTTWQALQTVFTATGSSVWLNVYAQGSVYIDNFFIVEMVETQGAVKSPYMAPFTNVGKTPAATGSDRMGYNLQSGSGGQIIIPRDISQSHPISNLGTNWYFMCWVKRNEISTWDLLLSISSPNSNHGDGIGFRSAGDPGGGISVQRGANISFSGENHGAWRDNDQWQHICVTCQTGVSPTGIRVYHNGVLFGTSGSSIDFNLAEDDFFVLGSEFLTGYNMGASIDGRDKEMALVRLGDNSVGALTDEDIRYIYESELPMFAQNAKSSTTSTSFDSIKAAAWDKEDGHLYVGHADGTDEFNGLVRVSTNTNAVTAAISVSRKLVASE